jgi:hypothetical protein
LVPAVEEDSTAQIVAEPFVGRTEVEAAVVAVAAVWAGVGDRPVVMEADCMEFVVLGLVALVALGDKLQEKVVG